MCAPGSIRLAPLCAACLALLASPARAEVYRWTDEQGRLHFTERLEQVPARFRPQAVSRASEARPNPVQTYQRPRPAAPRRAPELRIPFERHGTLMLVSARLNDQIAVPFYVDTGASGVSVPRAVVERLGIRIGPETPRAVVSTANGPVRVPVVRLDAVELGGARVEGLEAMVSASMEIGLLGGTFFNNFVYGVDAAEGVITLRPNEGIRGGLRAEQWRRRFGALRASLDELEHLLAAGELTSPGRRRELEERREQLRALLDELTREATLAGVPASWRQ